MPIDFAQKLFRSKRIRLGIRISWDLRLEWLITALRETPHTLAKQSKLSLGASLEA